LKSPSAPGPPDYTSEDIEQLIEIDRLVLVVTASAAPLRPMNDDELDRMNDGTEQQGEPYAYSRYGDQLRLYPTPRHRLHGPDRRPDAWWLARCRRGFQRLDHLRRAATIRALAKRNVLADVIQAISTRAGAGRAGVSATARRLWAQTHARTATGEMACYA
jgi:hypothetical protein